MKRLLLTLSALLAVIFTSSAIAVIPQPLSVTKHNRSFTIFPSTTIVCESEELMPITKYMQEYLDLSVATNKTLNNNYISITLDSTLAEEGYRLSVSNLSIKIAAGGYGGAFNGVQTLFQLLPSVVYTKQMPLPVIVQGCDIADRPKFAYRGFMLDVARTFMTKDNVLKYIDYIAYHKINKLHWHLTDDQGWRIEIKSHPKLAQVGGFRGGDSPLCSALGKWSEKYGGYYTQEDIRDIVAYAALRNIEVIPEIDLPGHSSALARVYPEVLCNYEVNTSRSAGYDTRNVVCATNENNYKLLEDILAEVASLFPSKYIHIGGDEVHLSQWRKCPDCSSWLKNNGFTDGHKLEDLFIERIQKILAKYDKLPAVWNEATNGGGLSKEARVHGWKSSKACISALQRGYRTVISPQQFFYLDMRQSQHETGAVWGGRFDVSKVYSFDIASLGLSQEEIALIEGFEAPFWSEISLSQGGDRSIDFVEYQTFPRLCALAEQGWGRNGGEWQEFHNRLYLHHYERMAAMGINFRVTPPKVVYADGVLTIEKIDNSTIYYRKDGSDKATLYTNAIRTSQPGQYIFWSECCGAKSPEVAHSSRYNTIRPSVKLTSSMPENPKYGFARVAEYSESIRTSRTCHKGDWVLFEFDEPVECRAIEFCVGFYASPARLFKVGYLEVSEDGEHFKRVADLEYGHAKLTNPRPIKAARLVAECDGAGQSYIVIVSPKIYPKW